MNVVVLISPGVHVIVLDLVWESGVHMISFFRGLMTYSVPQLVLDNRVTKSVTVSVDNVVIMT